MNTKRQFHTHNCQQCFQLYTCDGQPVGLLSEVTCPFYNFSNWHLCPVCAL